MTDGYDCYQNALAERINGILKTEFLLYRPENLQQARQMVSQSVRIYNQERPHLALQYKTPEAVHRAFLKKQLNTELRSTLLSTYSRTRQAYAFGELIAHQGHANFILAAIEQVD
jgi:hypothetical protein